MNRHILLRSIYGLISIGLLIFHVLANDESYALDAEPGVILLDNHNFDIVSQDCAGYYQLAEDIDASKFINSIPLCKSFSGTLDGNGYKIKNLKKMLFYSGINGAKLSGISVVASRVIDSDYCDSNIENASEVPMEEEVDTLALPESVEPSISHQNPEVLRNKNTRSAVGYLAGAVYGSMMFEMDTVRGISGPKALIGMIGDGSQITINIKEDCIDGNIIPASIVEGDDFSFILNGVQIDKQYITRPLNEWPVWKANCEKEDTNR